VNRVQRTPFTNSIAQGFEVKSSGSRQSGGLLQASGVGSGVCSVRSWTLWVQGAVLQAKVTG
jgi:hypothetical protein